LLRELSVGNRSVLSTERRSEMRIVSVSLYVDSTEQDQCKHPHFQKFMNWPCKSDRKPRLSFFGLQRGFLSSKRRFQGLITQNLL
jgi:hypothetical protein